MAALSEENEVTVERVRKLEQRLEAYYQAHAPSKLDNVASLASVMVGDEEQLSALLQKKYGSPLLAREPSAAEEGGVGALEAQLRGVSLTSFRPIRPIRPIRLLELFSGTGSVGKVAKEKGWEVVSVDIDPRADIKIDIMEWDYKSLDEDFDVVWASPPCNMYSKYQNMHIPNKHLRDLGPSNRLVMKSIEIITYFQPLYFFIENPQTGILKEQSFIQPLSFHDVDYCMYGYGSRKRTRIWTNYTEFEGKLCDKTCGAYGFHLTTNYNQPVVRMGHPYLPVTLDARHAIPAPLIRDLFAFA